MIVDLVRNDVGRLALIGSVGMEEFLAVETYPTLTMVSTVTARLKPATGVTNKSSARCFPCGSITGAPKFAAMEIIRELEESPRGLYCGAIGHFAARRLGEVQRCHPHDHDRQWPGHARDRRSRRAATPMPPPNMPNACSRRAISTVRASPSA